METNTKSELKKRSSKALVAKNLRLTKRDLEILEFGLEMKFFSIDMIKRRFFPELLRGYPVERIWRLKTAGLLTSHRISFSGHAYYVVTEKGFRNVAIAFVNKSIVSPLSSIDIRTFEHDRFVTEVRLMLEAAGRVQRWTSERALKSRQSILGNFSRAYMPDAVFMNHRGEEVAIEIEISLKTESRYRDKIAKFEELIHTSRITGQGVTQVLFVCVSEESFEALSKLITDRTGSIAVRKLTDIQNLKPFDPNPIQDQISVGDK